MKLRCPPHCQAPPRTGCLYYDQSCSTTGARRRQRSAGENELWGAWPVSVGALRFKASPKPPASTTAPDTEEASRRWHMDKDTMLPRAPAQDGSVSHGLPRGERCWWPGGYPEGVGCQLACPAPGGPSWPQMLPGTSGVQILALPPAGCRSQLPHQ